MSSWVFNPVGSVRRLLGQSVLLALGQVWTNKFRAVLTALGIIIGVLGVTVVGTGLEGMQGYVLHQFEKTGARKIWLWGMVPQSKRTTMSWSDAKLTTTEARLILQHAESVESLTPECYGAWDVSYGKKVAKGVQVKGVWPEWNNIEDRQVIYGRPFSRIDIDENRQVCLINEQGIEELNLNTDPSGDYILVGGRRFLVIGVVETKEAGIFEGGQSRTELLIPYSTHKMMNPYSWTQFTLQTVSPERSADAQAEIRFILRNSRNLGPEDEDTFDMWVMQSAIDQFNQMAWVIKWVAAGIVFVSLIVGGVGIMNIMLVSVSERTREIGLRKAVGAKPPVVLMQFLVEAVVLCVFGGVIGLLSGQLIVSVCSLIPNFPLKDLQVPAWAVIVSLGFSILVGVFFGMFPAIKAALLNPIDALRHE